MKYMILVKATKDSERSAMPTEALLQEMIGFHEEMSKAGILVDGAGLHASSKGWRILYGKDGKRSFVDGPFAETKELIAGFWIFDVKSKEEAIEWVRRSPMQEGELEIRRVFEAEDFGDALPEHVKEWEAQERARQEAQRS